MASTAAPQPPTHYHHRHNCVRLHNTQRPHLVEPRVLAQQLCEIGGLRDLRDADRQLDTGDALHRVAQQPACADGVAGHCRDH